MRSKFAAHKCPLIPTYRSIHNKAEAQQVRYGSVLRFVYVERIG